MTLDLRYNQIDHGSLKSLDINIVGAKDIAGDLKINQSLKRFDLGGNHFGDDGAKKIADALNNNH